jgi:oligopeptide/dipeptide ABC transporter ATP-binding protein
VAEAKLAVHGLTVRYGTGSSAVTAVDAADFELPAGKTIGIVGESGSGKSSLARAVVGLVDAVGGKITLDGVDVTSPQLRNRGAFRQRVQMIFQDPYASLNPRMTCGEAMMEAIGLRDRAQSAVKDRRAEAARLLGLVGLGPGDLDRYPHEFSGGQRQRIAIARALAVGPEVIIHDEITSALDVSVQATVLNLLRELQRELGLSYVVISHDLAVVRVMSDFVSVMYAGRMVEVAARDELFVRPTHPYTRALLASIPTMRTDRKVWSLIPGEPPDPRKLPTGCRFHNRCPIGPLALKERSICVEMDPQAVVDMMPHRAACHFAKSAPSDLAIPELVGEV